MTTAVRSGAPLWVSVEGINGVGKTSVARATTAVLGARCVLLDELTDQTSDVLPGQVIAALSGDGDPFLRTGHPVVETLALLALQVRKTERLAGRDLGASDDSRRTGAGRRRDRRHRGRGVRGHWQPADLRGMAVVEAKASVGAPHDGVDGVRSGCHQTPTKR